MTDEQRDLALIKTRRTMKKLNRIRRDLKLPPRALTVIAEIYAGSLASVVDGQSYARAVQPAFTMPPPRFPRPQRTENLGIFGTHDVADFSDDFDIDLPRSPLGFNVPPFPGDCCGVPAFDAGSSRPAFRGAVPLPFQSSPFHGAPNDPLGDLPPLSPEEEAVLDKMVGRAPLPPKP